MDETNKVITQTLELLDSACQASLELMRFFSEGKVNEVIQLVRDLRAVVSSVSDTKIADQLEHSCMVEMLENVEDTLDEIEQSIQTETSERAAMKMEFQLFPFLRALKEGFYFWGTIYPDKDKMDRYYQDEFAEHFQNYYIQSGQPTPYRLSVVIPAYNHLDVTKRCVEQLLNETDFDALNAELILIDHGSTDGTLEYFESLGVGKVIHFKRNVRMYMFAILCQICQGQYFCFVSNDILVTRDWAKILLNCLESDPRIIAAVPATPNIANLQMLDPPTNDPDEFIAWANQQNTSDPLRWNDRARLMPPLGMYQTDAVNKIGFADPYFYTMEFWDDDFSLRARRAGYRQIVCSDVACYHFGSVTGKEAQKKEGTLVYGRDLFLRKDGVDAWGIGFCYDYQAVQIFRQLFGEQKDFKVLGLDCGMGDTLLQIKNELRHLGRGCRLYQLTSQKEYLPDIQPHSEQAYFVPELAEGLDEAFGEERFDLAYLGRDIGQYENCSGLLETVSRRLAPGGWFVFACENPFFAPTLHALLQFSLPNGALRYVLTNPDQLRTAAEKQFPRVQVFSVERPLDGIGNFAALHYGKGNRLAPIVSRLKISQYYFLCGK